MTGTPVPLVDGVLVKPDGAADFSVSDNGRLVYGLGAGGVYQQRSLVWVDPDGQEEPLAAPLRAYLYARISPDGTRVAVNSSDEDRDIWVWNGEILTRLTFDAGEDTYGHWTPDGDRLVFSSNRDGTHNIYWRAADGTGTAERLTESDIAQWVNGVTPAPEP